MKMNKIIALAVAAMTLSTTAFAASTPITHPEYGCIYLEEPYTQDEVKARTVDVDMTVTAVTAADAKAAGMSMGFGPIAKTDDKNDFYKIELAVSNFGDLYHGFDPSFGQHNVTLFMIDVRIPEAASAAVTNSTFNGVAWKAGAGSDGVSLTWTSGTDMASALPVNSGDYGVYEANLATGVATFYIATENHAADKTVTPYINDITYYVDGVATGCKNGNFVNGSTVTLAADKAAAADPVEFSAALAEDTDFGYIWALTFTKSADKLASFTAKFEADGVEPAERTVANASAIATALAGKSAPVVLNVGLSTTKTLTKATFTADDADDTTDACVVVAPLSK